MNRQNRPASYTATMPRQAALHRTTSETDIRLDLDLDPAPDAAAAPNTPRYSNSTGVGFFDHMLDHIAKHGRLGLTVAASGDTDIDDHHTVEDVGLVFGEALLQALGDKRGIERYGHAYVPMDDALARVVLDLSGRPALVYRVEFNEPLGKIGTFDNQLVREFFNAVANAARMNCHIECCYGLNDHHIA